MKARLVPVYFPSEKNEEFHEQLKKLKELLSLEAEITEPIPLGSSISEADAVIFPQLVGEAYRQIAKIKNINIPILAVTSEFGTIAMWDWEIVTFLNSEGLKTFAPYNLELTKIICRALGAKREMKQTKFLVFQDNPGDGMQASIFKRFFWWENECSQRITSKFGVEIKKKSYKNLAQKAMTISNYDAEMELCKRTINAQNVSKNALLSATKLYLAINNELKVDNTIRGVGINCLNESFHSDTTPCLAWNFLFEDKRIMWACEADLLSLLTEYIIYSSLHSPIMMSNIYPFLMGMAALKHEKIDKFPEVEDPDNNLLIAHCGYMGCMPRSFADRWALKEKVLEIVDENAVAIDARMPIGETTITELHPTLEKILVIEGDLANYAQYPGSDCRNGALIKVKNGHKLMNKLYSHHGCIITGHKAVEIKQMAKVFNFDIEDV